MESPWTDLACFKNKKKLKVNGKPSWRMDRTGRSFKKNSSSKISRKPMDRFGNVFIQNPIQKSIGNLWRSHGQTWHAFKKNSN